MNSVSTTDTMSNGNGAGKDRDYGPQSSHATAAHPLISVQPPRREDLQPSYASVLKPDTEDASQHGWYGGTINTLGQVMGNLGAIPCCFCCPNPYKPVQQGNVGLVTKFGRFSRAVDPGLVKINPLSERLLQVDVKIQIVGALARYLGSILLSTHC